MVLYRAELRILLLAGLAACSGSAEDEVSADATTRDAAPMTVQSFVEQQNDNMCDAAMICGVDDISIYCEPLPFDPMDYEGCTLNEVVVDACLTDDWTCFQAGTFSAPLPPDSCKYAMDCPIEETPTTDTGVCACTVEWVAQIGGSLDCVADSDLCRGDLVGGVWDADVKQGLGYREYALAWSTLKDVDLGGGAVPLVFEDIPCGRVTGYAYLNRNGIEGLGPGDVGSFASLEISECEDGGTASQDWVLNVAF